MTPDLGSPETSEPEAPLTPEPALTLDLRGQLCPLPVIGLAKRITEVGVGSVVAVLADDPAAAADIPAWARMRGHDYLGATPAAASATAETSAGATPAASSDGAPGGEAALHLIRRTS